MPRRIQRGYIAAQAGTHEENRFLGAHPLDYVQLPSYGEVLEIVFRQVGNLQCDAALGEALRKIASLLRSRPTGEAVEINNAVHLRFGIVSNVRHSEYW